MLISSITVINESHGYFIGGWYIGLFACLAGARGMRFSSWSGLNWTVGLAVTSMIVSLIGTILQKGYFTFLDELEACSVYGGNQPSSCGNFTFVETDDYSNYYVGNFRCTGNKNYYPYAATCEASKLADGTSENAHQCACVSSHNTNDCWNFKHMNLGNCDKLLNEVPDAINTCFIIGLLTVFASTALVTYACMSQKHPDLAMEDVVMATNGDDLTIGVMSQYPNRDGASDTVSVVHATRGPTPTSATYCAPPVSQAAALPVSVVESRPAQGTVISVQQRPEAVQY